MALSRILLLLFLLPLTSFAQEESYSDPRLYLGLSGSIAGSSGTAGVELGLMIDHDNEQSTYVSLMPGMIFPYKKSPLYSSSSGETFADSLLDALFPPTFNEYTDGPEYFGQINIGHFFTRQFGLIASGGLSVESKVTLKENENSIFSATLVRSRRVYHGLVGLEAAYQDEIGGLYRVGYNTRRGVSATIGIPLSPRPIEIDSTKLIPSYLRSTWYLGAGVQRGVFTGARSHVHNFLLEASVGYLPDVRRMTMTTSMGWISRSAVMGEGHYYSFVHTSQTDFSSGPRYPRYATANVGWLSQHDGSTAYHIAAGAGVRYETHVPGSEDFVFKSKLYFNLEASIGFTYLTRLQKVMP